MFRRRKLSLQPLERRQLMAGDVSPFDRPLGATYQDTAEFLLGRIAVTPVFLNSDPADPTQKTQQWTPGEIDGVLENVELGLQWWVDTLANQNSIHSLDFVVDTTFADNPVNIPSEPIDQSSSNYPTHVRDFLSAVGVEYAGTHDNGMFVFNDAQRKANEADWSFTIFLADASDDADGFFPATGGFRGAFAVPGGLYVFMPSTRPVRTIAHEIGHIFWGFDEYNNTDSHYASRGYYNSPNSNGLTGAPAGFVQEDSIMASDVPMLDAFLTNTSAASTLAVMGWQDSDGDGIFDVLDVPLSLTGSGHFDADAANYRFVGRAQVQTLVNQNTEGPQSDITLNRVSRLQARIDDGSWQDVLTPDAYAVDLDVTIDLPATWQSIDLRVIDDITGITSETLTGTRTLPMTSAASIVGYAFSDANNDGIRTADESLLDHIDLTLTDASGNPLPTGQLDFDELPMGQFLDPVDGMTLTGDGLNVDNGVQVLPDLQNLDRRLLHLYDTQFNSYISRLSVNRALRVTFEEPVGYVEVDVMGLSDRAYGRVEAYNAAGELIDRVTTDLRNHTSGFLGDGELQTLTLHDSAAEIASVRVYGHAGGNVGARDIRYGHASTLSTNAAGVFSLDGLADGVYTITATPRTVIEGFTPAQVTVSGGQFVGDAAALAARRVDSPRYNAALPEDVNGRDGVTAVDALQIINNLNARENAELGFDELTGPNVDVNNDGRVTAIDALRVINYLNANDGFQASGESTRDRDTVFARGDWDDDDRDSMTISFEDGDRPRLV